MAEETQYKVTKNDKEYDCGEIEISTEKWYSLLNEPKAKQYIDVLVAFLREPGHKGSCYTVAQKHNDNPQSYNAKVMHFGKWVNAQIGNFTVFGTDDNPTYWAIPMRFGWETKEGFVWQMREELVEALRKFLLEKLIFEFEQQYVADPHDVKDEIYKWELLQKTDDKDNLFIANAVKSENIVYIPSATTVYNYLGKENPGEFNDCLNHLFDRSKDLVTRIHDFKHEILTLIPSTWNYTANDERAASALLTCKYPDEYTFYMSKVYECICLYLGIEKKKTGKKYAHFMDIINKITLSYGDKIQNIIQKEIEQYPVKPKNLAVQTVFWVMLDKMTEEMKQNAKFTWIPFYQELADKLLKFKNDRKSLLNILLGLDYGYIKSIFDKKDYPVKDIDPFSVFSIFNKKMSEEKRLDVASYFKESFDIKSELPLDFCGVPVIHPLMALFFAREDAMNDIQPLWDLFEIAINYKDEEFIDKFDIVRKQKCIKWNITMGLFWIRPYDYIALDANNRAYLSELGFQVFDEKSLNAENYLNLMDDIDEKIKKHQIAEKDYPTISYNAVTDYADEMNNSYYIDLLKANHNIIFNGAPGTGKTYLAKEIAKEMNAMVKMVQFHPSYDYTDFVEGLRPIKDEKGNICFERKDGVFKEFCKKAINEPTSPFVFIIDEINRGEISKIFGELFYSIDPGYRGEKGKVQTQYQNLVEEGDVFKDGFYVPENVYIIGTMNDIDRSVESMDFAMRRRFAWQEITANESAQNMGIEGELLERMERLNAVIFETEGLGSSYQVGASMFLKVKEGDMTEEQLWNLNLKSLMKEYLRDLPQAEDILDKMKKAYFLEGDSEDDAHANDDVSAEY